jgi:hypothetical protein
MLDESIIRLKHFARFLKCLKWPFSDIIEAIIDPEAWRIEIAHSHGEPHRYRECTLCAGEKKIWLKSEAEKKLRKKERKKAAREKERKKPRREKSRRKK